MSKQIRNNGEHHLRAQLMVGRKNRRLTPAQERRAEEVFDAMHRERVPDGHEAVAVSAGEIAARTAKPFVNPVWPF